MTALSVEIRDHSDYIMELLEAKIRGGIFEASQELASQYREKLSSPAPPHSQPGEMPHAYLGHKEGGYGPTSGPPLSINNPGQVDFLKNYIRGGMNGVGFAPSHVSGRDQNYLIRWDTGQFFRTNGRFARRTWIKRGYEESKQAMIQAFKAGFRETN